MKNYIQLFLLLLVSAFSFNCGSRNFVVKSGSLCRCNVSGSDSCSDLSRNWQYTNDSLLGVSATDFIYGDYVGTSCQAEADWYGLPLALDWPPVHFNSWRPVDGYKHCTRGPVQSFFWGDGYHDEDWNFKIWPFVSKYLVTEVESLHEDTRDIHKEGCLGFSCIKSEISPDQQLWTINPWCFQKGKHPLDTKNEGYFTLAGTGKQIGFYGLWVMDANHDFAAELHPTEMIWFKENRDEIPYSGPVEIYTLMFLEDNTGRFDDEDNFDCGGIIGDNIPAGWRPWQQSPRSGQFNIAFEVDPKKEVINFSIEELFNRFVVTSQDPIAYEDADDGTSHALEFNGKVVIRVDENQPNDDDLGVTFTNLCLTGGGTLRGFVSIRSKIGGDDDRDEEGYHILSVSKYKGSNKPPVRPPVTADYSSYTAIAREVAGSVKNNRKFFTGDFQLMLNAKNTADKNPYKISKAEFIGENIRQQINFDQKQNSTEVLVRDIPLVADGKIILTTTSNHTYKITPPALSFAPMIKDTLIYSVIDTNASAYLPASVGAMSNSYPLTDKRLLNLTEFQLKLLPGYATFSDDEMIADDSAFFARQVNEAIFTKNQKGLTDLFGSAEPFNIRWTFEATNLATGKKVPVYTNNKLSKQGVQVELFTSRFPNDSLKIKFPSSVYGGIIEFHAKATIKNFNGKDTTVVHRLWSHGFNSTLKNLNEYASLIQALTGLKDKSILLPPDPGKGANGLLLVQDAKMRQARILNTYMKYSLRDKKITIQELKKTIGTLKKFAVI